MASPLHSLANTTRKTLALKQSALSFWHSVVFVLNIGIPALVGWWSGEVQLGLIGALIGLLFSLADSDERLSERMWLLVRATAMVLAFGVLGSYVGGYSTIFWLAFVGVVFGAGWLSLSGHTGASSFRYGALALVSTAGLPSLGVAALQILALCVAVSGCTRVIGHLLFPDAATVFPVAKPRQRPEFTLALRYCLAYAVAVAAGLLIGHWRELERPTWVATTVLLVMQPDPQSNYERIAQRIVGTCAGVLAATLVIGTLHSAVLLGLAVLAIAFVLPHGSTRSYWLHSALTAWLILVLYDFVLAGHNFNQQLLRERVTDVLIGCALTVVATLIAFPPTRSHFSPDIGTH